MHNKLYLFILSLFVAISAAAQNIEITVKLGNEPAEYAFIFKMGVVWGIAIRWDGLNFRLER